MAIEIKIKKLGGSFVDRTTSIKWDTFNIEQALTKEVDTMSFTVSKYGSLPYMPEVEDEVQVLDDGVKIFGGFIVNVEEKANRNGEILYSARARDYTHLLNRKLISKTYTNQTELQIITDIINNYAAPGLTVVNVSGTNTIAKIAFDDTTPSAAIQKLADIFNKDWYVDYDKDIHYFGKSANAAPFSLTDTSDNYIFSSLKLKRDSTQIKNSVKVEAGNELSTSTFYDKYIGDGQQHTFKASYQYANTTATINGVAKTIGLDGIDDFTTKDILYNFQNFTFRVDPAVPVPSGQQIVFGGNFYFPITTVLDEAISISTYGRREATIVDKSIKDRNTARQRAKAEIYAFATPVREGQFETYESGLRPGQKLTIASTIRGWTENFIINGVSIEMETPEKFIYKVSIVSSKSYDVMDLLAEIFNKDQDELSQDSVQQTGQIALMTTKFQRVITIRPFTPYEKNIEFHRDIHRRDFTPTWVLGPYFPTDWTTDNKRAFKLDVSTLS